MFNRDVVAADRVARCDIIAAMSAKSPQQGPNGSPWPGLTLYRFTAPQVCQWDEVRSLTLCVVAQGRKSVRSNGFEYRYDPLNYFVFNRGIHSEIEILECSIERPFLSFVLRIDPALVRKVIAHMGGCEIPVGRQLASRRTYADPYVAPLDQQMTDAILRFLRSLDSGADRRVLAPMYLQEIVYRLMQGGRCGYLIDSASSDIRERTIRASVDYVRAHISESVTVNAMAAQACMSPSAFAHHFRESIGVSPYQLGLPPVRLTPDL